MKFLYVGLIAAAVVALRVWLFKRRRRNAASSGSTPSDSTIAEPTGTPRRSLARSIESSFGDVGKVAMREITERLRGRIFRVGTLLILAIVGAAIIIPAVTKSSGVTKQTVGVVGGLSKDATLLVRAAARQSGDTLQLVDQPTRTAAEDALRSGKIDIAIVENDEIILNQPVDARRSPADATFVQDLAAFLGALKSYQTAGLTPHQASLIAHAKPIPVRTLEGGSKNPKNATYVIGLVLLFIMLTQYCTWILIGVMQEKSSRVVEVLLATLRPIELLGGKVLGIGLVALGQATLVVGFALILGKAVGSDFLHGAAALVVLAEFLWLVLGYAFYCWVYAAAGSTAERQDQIQTLALPLSIPILIGYVLSITVASTGNASTFYKFLAYVPPTAPFCMPTLVGLGDVSWWQFVASALISLVATYGMAVFAARIYRRAVLQTGGRVRIRQLFARPAR